MAGKYDMRDIAKARLKKMQDTKTKGGKMMPKGKESKYDYEDEEMSADMEEKTPSPEEHNAPKHLMHKGRPGLGGDQPKGIAVMIGIGKPGMPKRHPGLGESIEDEEPVMGGKYGR